MLVKDQDQFTDWMQRKCWIDKRSGNACYRAIKEWDQSYFE